MSRPKPLLLLAYLALEGPRDRRFLAELLWPEAADARKSLGVALARVRRGAPGTTEADGTRVWTLVTCDAAAFLGHLERGERDRALALHQGRFLAGVELPRVSVEFEEWVYQTREFLAGRVVAASLDLAEREARAGQVAPAAERAATAFRSVDPSSLEPEELVRLYTLLRAGDHPRAAEVRAEAAELGLDLVGSSAEARTRLGVGARTSVPNNLPARGTAFVGRDLELTELGTLVSRSDLRLLSVVGPPGVGKTRLALQVGREQVEAGAFQDGVLVASLEALPEAGLISSALVDALGVEASATDDPFEVVVARLRDADALLILDNVEHVLEGAETFARLLRACPRLTMLATSRERLDLEEEQVFPVAGLPYPPGTPTLEEAQRYDAVKLFVRRAQRARRGFELTERNLPHVLEICRAVDGMPLALELAAVWVRVMPCDEIAREIAHDLGILSATTRDLPARHRSLRAAFEHSWRLSSDKERTVLRRLAVCRGGFQRSAAQEIAGATLVDLASLVDKSMVRLTSAWRYERHPLLYRFTQEKLAEDPEEERAARERHAAFYLRLLHEQSDTLGFGTARRPGSWAVLEHELENLRVAWRWLAENGRAGELEGASTPLQEFFTHRQRMHDGLAWLEEGLAAIQGEGTAHRAAHGTILTNQALLLYRAGAFDRAAELAQRGWDLLPAEGNVRGKLHARTALGLLAWRRGAPAEAEVHLQEALRLAREAQGGAVAYPYLHNLALVQRARGHYQHAEATLLEVLSLARERGDTLNAAHTLNSLGDVNLLQGQLSRAEAYLREGLALAEEAGSAIVEALLRLNLALAAYDRDDPAGAEAHASEALATVREAGPPQLVLGGWGLVGRAASARGQPSRARDAFLEAVRLMPSLGGTSTVLKVLSWLAEFRVGQGHHEEVVPVLHHVVHHAATEPDDRALADALLSDVRKRAPERTQAQEERARTLGLDGVVEQLTAALPHAPLDPAATPGQSRAQ